MKKKIMVVDSSGILHRARHNWVKEGIPMLDLDTNGVHIVNYQQSISTLRGSRIYQPHTSQLDSNKLIKGD